MLSGTGQSPKDKHSDSTDNEAEWSESDKGARCGQGLLEEGAGVPAPRAHSVSFIRRESQRWLVVMGARHHQGTRCHRAEPLMSKVVTCGGWGVGGVSGEDETAASALTHGSVGCGPAHQTTQPGTHSPPAGPIAANTRGCVRAKRRVRQR